MSHTQIAPFASFLRFSLFQLQIIVSEEERVERIGPRRRRAETKRRIRNRRRERDTVEYNDEQRNE